MNLEAYLDFIVALLFFIITILQFHIVNNEFYGFVFGITTLIFLILGIYGLLKKEEKNE